MSNELTIENTNEDQFLFQDTFLRMLSKRNMKSTPNWCSETFEIDEECSKKILLVCNNSDVALYILLMALCKCVIEKFSNQNSVSIVSSQLQKNRKSINNSYVIFTSKIYENIELKENIEHVKDNFLKACTRQELIFKLSDNDDRIQTLIKNKVLISYFNKDIEKKAIKNIFPFSVYFYKKDEKISVKLTFDYSRLEKLIVKSFCNCLSYYINNASDDFTRKSKDINIMRTSEIHKMMEFSKGDVCNITSQCIHQLFEKFAIKNPNSVAIYFNGEKITYKELNDRANILAESLIRYEIKPNNRVALLYTHGIEMIIAILAVLKTGAAFVPISSKEPKERREFIISASNSRLVLTNLKSEVTGKNRFLTISELLENHTIDNRNAHLDYEQDNESSAYIIFTSGTTGLPKGVEISHKSIVNSSIWNQNEFSLKENERFLLLFPYNFDGAIIDIFTALICGSPLVIINDEDVKDPEKIAQHIENHRINQIKTISILYKSILGYSQKYDFSTLERVGLAGDFIDPEAIELSHNFNKNIKVSNLYGPTENAVVSTYLEDVEIGAVNVIGKPISNVNVYILDEEKAIRPIGAFGEIYLSGIGLAKGYINNKELTDEKFLEWNNERVFKTGDIARWLPNGTIEIKGRVDNQVKVRGFRVELEEIKNVIVSHELINEAVVLTIGNRDNARIHACISTKKKVELDQKKLNEYITRKLPEYMRPVFILNVPKIPRLQNGKYDTGAIKIKIEEFQKKSKKELPTNNIETKLLDIFRSILEIESIGINENFFVLGGHSLKANLLLSRIHQEFGLNFSLRTIFLANTVKEIAKEIKKRENQLGDGTLIEKESDSQSSMISVENSSFDKDLEEVLSLSKIDSSEAILSYSQISLWYINQFMEDKGVYNIPIAFSINGAINKKALKYALGEIVDRHEILRSIYKQNKKHQCIQYILPNQSVKIVEFDLSSISNNDFMVNEAISKHALEAFDLSQDSMLRAVLITKSDKEQILLFVIHHIAFDGMSIKVFMKELDQLYKDFLENKVKTLPPLSIQYRNFAVWQRNYFTKERLERLTSFWKSELEGMPDVHKLPLDFSRPQSQDYKGQHYNSIITKDYTNKIKNFMAENNVSLFMFFHAVYVILLYAWSTERDIIIGTPVSGRVKEVFNSIIGYFANTVILRTIINDDLDFRTFLSHNKEKVLKAYEHQEMPFDLLVKQINPKRMLGVNPLFQLSFTMIEKDGEEFEFSSIDSKFFRVKFPFSKFDLSLYVSDKGEYCEVMWEYNTNIFKEKTIEKISDYYQTLLSTLVNESAQSIKDLISSTNLLKSLIWQNK